MPNFTAIVTLLAVILYFWFCFQVAQARVKFGIKPPAMTGNPGFERVFRIQMNTLEWMPIFLPAIWLAAIYVSDIGAALLGVVWIAGRALYMRGYTEATEKRHPGFLRAGDRSGVALARSSDRRAGVDAARVGARASCASAPPTCGTGVVDVRLTAAFALPRCAEYRAAAVERSFLS
jgi:glutathione S-transferase